MQKIKQALHRKGHEHDNKHAAAVDETPVAQVVPGSAPITGTYSKTEAEYLAATGDTGYANGGATSTIAEEGRSTEDHMSGSGASAGMGAGAQLTSSVEGERAVGVAVAEVPVVVLEQERVVGTGHKHHNEHHHTATTGTNTTAGGLMTESAATRHSERHSEHHHHEQHISGSSSAATASNMTAAATGSSSISTGSSQQAHQTQLRVGEEVCGTKTFSVVEDRPVIRERVETIVEHRPVEEEFVVETRFVGEQALGVAGAEIVGTKERVVDVAAPGPTCPANTGAIMNEVVEGISHLSTTGGGAASATTHHSSAGISDNRL